MRNYDIDVPASTIRAWVIGMVLCTVGSGLNSLFTLRAPAITITSVVAQLVAYPLGVGWTWIMPNRTFKTFGREWNLNPGPFNIKEHTLIVVMANASFGNGAAYFTDTIVAQRGFYNQSFGEPPGSFIPMLFPLRYSTLGSDLLSAVLSFRMGLQHPLRPFHANCRIRSRWTCPSVPGGARVHDMAQPARQFSVHVCTA